MIVINLYNEEEDIESPKIPIFSTAIKPHFLIENYNQFIYYVNSH